MSSKKALAGVLLAGLFAGCGGGGGGSADAQPSASVFTFPALTAASFANPAIAQYVVSGDCTGAEVRLRGPLTPASFGGQAVSGVTTSTDRVLRNCAFAGSTSNLQTTWYDANFLHVGETSSSGPVAVSDAPWALPLTVKPGDSGSYGADTVYADSSRTKVLSHATHKYVVQADSPATALAILTTTETDPSGNVLHTEKVSYQLRQGASPLLLSVDDQYASTPALHLVRTPGAAATTIPAGSTVTLGAGELLLVPAGTSLDANGSTNTVGGQWNTFLVPAGAVVTVPASAAGPADNVVMAR